MAKSRRDSADYYTLKAQKEGYPARSVYKLEEIQQKHNIIKKGDKVLDIGAAPGSWSLYTHRRLIKGVGLIVSVDLKPLALDSVPPTIISLTGDAFSQEISNQIAELGPFDAIISDAAPNTTGNKGIDTLRSESLVEQVILTAEKHLKVGGNLVVKLFQGSGERELLNQVRSLFEKAKAFKPQASRSDSYEIFLIGLSKKQNS
ncbi:MAG: RlmE family RNA methyltransferase [Sphaerochaetaceae bacterium]|jgi:23S rRNA (uridine2552-2'-O)-methyltransferase